MKCSNKLVTKTATTLGEPELQCICQAVVAAAKLCQAVRSDQAMLSSMTKTDASPVTIADYGSQALICKTLKDIFPDDPIVAEEDASDLRTRKDDQVKQVTQYVAQQTECSSDDNVARWIDYGNGKPNRKRFWTLDPIDGTKGFLRGDQYALCLALIEGGDLQAGILACLVIYFWHSEEKGIFEQNCWGTEAAAQ